MTTAISSVVAKPICIFAMIASAWIPGTRKREVPISPPFLRSVFDVLSFQRSPGVLSLASEGMDSVMMPTIFLNAILMGETAVATSWKKAIVRSVPALTTNKISINSFHSGNANPN